MARIEHTPVKYMDVEEYQKVQIAHNLQQGWYKCPGNTGQRLRCPVMDNPQ